MFFKGCDEILFGLVITLRSYLNKGYFIFLMGKIIGVLSLKGGVGKTSSVISLGFCLAELGKKVLLVDCNFSAPNLGLALNVINPEKTLHHVLERSAQIKDAIHELDHFHVIPASIFKEPKINPLKLKDYIRDLKKIYDVILLDSSPALNDETLSVMLAADELLLITTPDHVTLGTTLKAVKDARERGFRVIGIILNKVYNKNFELNIEDIEKTIDVPVLAVIPHDVEAVKSVSLLKPWAERKPNSKGTIEYKKLAHVLVGEKYTANKIKNIINRMTPTRQEINREIFYTSVFG